MSCCDIKLIFISMVVAFSLYSTTAERNGPTKFPGIPRPQRRIGWKIPSSVFRGKNPVSSRFVSPGTWRGSSETSIRHLRRSLDLEIPPNEIINSVVDQSATYIEPMLLQKGGKPSSDKSLSVFDSLGPMIGPLNLPGFGKKLYLRLMVPPNEEEANYVTVHLTIKPGPIPLAENYNNNNNNNNGKLFPRKPWLGKLAATEETEEPNIPLEKEPLDHFIAQGFVAPEKMNWNPMHQVPFGFNASPPPPLPPPQPEQRPAPNHHQLPIVHRTLEKLIDLPIYPPLSPLRPGDGNRGAVGGSGNGMGVSNDGRTEVKIFPGMMQNSFGSSKYMNPVGSPPRGGIATKKNVVASQNPKHPSNDDISVTEGTRQASRVNDTPKLHNIMSGERVRVQANSDKN